MAFFFAQTHQETLGGYYRTEVNWSFSGNDEAYFNKKYGPNTSAGKNIGNTKEEDGYLFRGAGAIQLTGRYNYQKFSEAMNDSQIMQSGADYVAEKYFWEAAGYFWDLKNINKEIDEGATSDDISRIVNYYDKDTFEERKEKYNEAYKTLENWFE